MTDWFWVGFFFGGVFFNWNTVDQFQVYSKVIQLYTHIYFFHILFPYWLWYNIEHSFLCYTVGPWWLSVLYYHFSSVHLLSHVRLFATPWITARQASLSITNSWSSFKLMSIESVMPSSHLILCRPLLLLTPIPPSIRVFSNESTLRMRWPKYWSFSFSIISSKEHPGLISFRVDWLDLLVVQGTLKSLLQHHSSKASILQCSAFLTVRLSHPYMTTGSESVICSVMSNSATSWTIVHPSLLSRGFPRQVYWSG